MKKIILLLFCLTIFLPTRLVAADTGPKPSMEFMFSQQSTAEPLTIVSGILYECEQSDCSDAAPLEELGPQGFRCTENSCDAVAYGFAPYHRIEIEFSDGRTRQSNIFETAGFDSRYIVTIQPDDLLVDALFHPEIPFRPQMPSLIAILGVLCACILCGGIPLVAIIAFVVWLSSRR